MDANRKRDSANGASLQTDAHVMSGVFEHLTGGNKRALFIQVFLCMCHGSNLSFVPKRIDSWTFQVELKSESL